MNEDYIQAQRYLDLGESLNRLMKNEDFQKVFVEKYLKEDVIDEALAMAGQKEDTRHLMVERMVARGHLRKYMNYILETAMQCKQFINQYESEVE
jgi:hypothetical protein